jgi:hypothetical protein
MPRPVAGRASEKSVRTALAAITRRLKNPALSNKDFLVLLNHQSRLAEELRQIGVSRLEDAIAKAEGSNPDKGHVEATLP